MVPYLERRINKACQLYCERNGSNDHVFYVKLDYVNRKLIAQPDLIEKIIDKNHPMRVHDLLYSDISKYDQQLKKAKDAIVNQSEESLIDTNWETAHKCSCGQKKCRVEQVMTRCSDEGTTIKATCICGKKFVI